MKERAEPTGVSYPWVTCPFKIEARENIPGIAAGFIAGCRLAWTTSGSCQFCRVRRTSSKLALAGGTLAMNLLIFSQG